MKRITIIFATLSVLATTPIAIAQFGAADAASPIPGGGNPITEPIAKLFAAHPGFSCDLQVSGKNPTSKKSFTMFGKLAFLDSKSRFELDLTKVKGGDINDSMKAEVAAVGLGQMVMIARPDKNATYIVYPGLEAYAQLSQPKPAPSTAPKSASDQLIVTAVGNETIDGHPCVKNKYTFKDEAGKTQDAMVWNATDLKQFPIRIDHKEADQPVRLDFKNVVLSKPGEALFEPPKGYSKYSTLATMMQTEMLKKLGRGLLAPSK